MTARRIALSVSGLPKMLQGILHETLERLPEVVIVEVGPADALVTNGLFARRGADLLLLATPGGVQPMRRA